MADDKVKQNKKRPSTQAHLPIAEIKDGVVVLKDGTLRTVILVSSLNFALKSEDEQNSIISPYVGFLNSLDFPVQIVVQSRKLQIKPYLEKLKDMEREQTNELLRVQTADYRAFVEELVEIGQIMTKRYYVIVPYDPLNNRRKSFWARFKEALEPGVTIRLREERFKSRKEEMDLRVRHITNGRNRVCAWASPWRELLRLVEHSGSIWDRKPGSGLSFARRPAHILRRASTAPPSPC